MNMDKFLIPSVCFKSVSNKKLLSRVRVNLIKMFDVV